MDSFAELDRLQAAAEAAGVTARAGVRLTTDERGLWRKFGLPLADMPAFFAASAQRPNVDLRGVQFHTSWNMDATAQEGFIARLGQALAGMAPGLRARVEFVDVGGGYWPPAGEWLHATATPEGRLAEAVLASGRPPLGHFRFAAAPLSDFARRIAAAVRTHLAPHAPCRLHLEPGRWVCHEGMSILLTVLDRKGGDIAITDAGTNAIGWERFESDYFPLINLTRPSLDEKPFYVLGSLCTPHDVWGYFYFGEDIQPGDTLLIPCQGAYTYSLRQNFIKPLPKVARLVGRGA